MPIRDSTAEDEHNLSIVDVIYENHEPLRQGKVLKELMETRWAYQNEARRVQECMRGPGRHPR
jgi:hypothetical protein